MRRLPAREGRSCDVAIICPLEVEWKALIDTFQIRGDSTIQDSILGLRHLNLRLQSGLDVLFIQTPFPSAGNVTSAIVTSKILLMYDPWLIISFGIAMSRNEVDAKIGDVVYSRVVYYIGLHKDIGRDQILLKAVPLYETEHLVLNALAKVKSAIEKRRLNFQMHQADIASSEAVVKSNKAFTEHLIQKALADVTAVEMEAFGVLRATDTVKVQKQNPFAVAIKGVSDYFKRGQQNQPLAAANGAKVLRMFLEQSELESLRQASRVDTRPRPVRVFRRLDLAGVVNQVRKFLETVQPLLNDSPQDIGGLVQAHLVTKRPRLFLHWRLTDFGLHWVELRFLRIIRQLGETGYPIELLITDELVDAAHAKLSSAQIPLARTRIETILGQMLKGVDYHSHFLSDVRSVENELRSYAEPYGFGLAEIETLFNLRSIPGGQPKLNLELWTWFAYIARLCRDEGSCIVFAWCKREDVYKLLKTFSDLVSVILTTPDLYLGGKYGKFYEPGASLFLDPLRHERIIRWCNDTSYNSILAEFWRHLAYPRASVGDIDMDWQLTPDVPLPDEWRHSLDSKSDNLDYWRGAIALELARLNQEYFS